MLRQSSTSLVAGLVLGAALAAPVRGAETTVAANEPVARVVEAARVPRGYQIGPGDVLDVKVFQEDSLSGQLTVGADGTLVLPPMAPVLVLGRTPEQVAALLERELQRYLVDPQVTVQVAQYASHKVQVLGAVKNPGIFTLTGETTLRGILAAAGGVESEKSVHELRINHPDGTAEVINLEKLLAHGEGDEILHDGDVVYVTEGVLVYVSGEVGKPGPVPWHDGMTITQALSAAGGPSPTADLRHAYILRNDTRLKVNVRRIQKGRAEDLELAPGDRVFVDQSVF